MSNFKIGDEVTIVKNKVGDSENFVGHKGTIESINCYGKYILNNEPFYYWTEDELKLTEEDTMEEQCLCLSCVCCNPADTVEVTCGTVYKCLHPKHKDNEYTNGYFMATHCNDYDELEEVCPMCELEAELAESEEYIAALEDENDGLLQQLLVTQQELIEAQREIIRLSREPVVWQ